MTEINYWFDYGDPGATDRVPVILRKSYQTGPNEPARPDDIEFGTIPTDNLGLLDEEPFVDHIHSDGSITWNTIPEEDMDRLLDGFEPDRTRQKILDLTDAGCSPAEIHDYLMTEKIPVSQAEWSRRRGRSQQAINENVRKARKNLR